ncbi:hypothetical protein GCM10009745_48440 [Kribbella yunnanensis]|uniref:Tachylectin 2 domain-containing protein n=1 Tax=Kribbella yunnanensis TaxID=190194 RepID=A0ABN2I0P4_9ACTN
MRKTILSVAVAFVVAATGLVVLSSSSGAAVGDVPDDCAVATAAYRSDGQRLGYRYERNHDSPAQVLAIEGDRLPWVPTSVTLGNRWGGGGDSFNRLEFAVHPSDGYVYELDRAAERGDDHVWRMTKNTAKRLTGGFAGTRIIAYAYPYLYQVKGTALYRYTLTSEGLTSRVKMPGTAWDTVKTLVYERAGGTDAVPVHVLIGTKANGELKEWRIKATIAPPTSIPSSVLRSTGWGSFTSVSTGVCETHLSGRALLGIAATGSVSVYFDANAKDWDGTDIKGGSLGDLDWTAKAYGQTGAGM